MSSVVASDAVGEVVQRWLYILADFQCSSREIVGRLL